MNVIIDKNIILDVLFKREPNFQSSYDLLKHSITSSSEIMITATDAARLHSLCLEQIPDKRKANICMGRVLQMVSLTEVLPLDIRAAFDNSNKASLNPEAIIIMSVAERNEMDFIVVQDTAPYKDSEIPAITPEEFLHMDILD